MPRSSRTQLVLSIPILTVLAFAGGVDARPKVVMFVLDGTTWDGIAAADIPNANRLLAAGAAANMSCVPARPPSRLGAYVTLGAGNRAFAPAWPHGVPQPANVQGGLFLREMPQVIAANEPLQRYYAIDIGALGTCLHDAGLRTAVFATTRSGAADAMLIAADRDGRVDDGRLPETGDSTRAAWDARFEEALENGDFVVARIGGRGGDMDTPAELRAADDFLGRALPKLHREWMVLLISPAPGGDAFDHMTPVIIRSPAHTAGLLTSGTTQRPGIIHSIDIAPTILDYLGVAAPSSFNGRRATTAPSAGDRVRELVAADARAHENRGLRVVFIPAFSGYVALVIALTIAGALARGQMGAALRCWAGSAALGAFAVPTAAYLVRLAVPPGPGAAALIGMIAAAAAALAVIAARLRGRILAPIGFLCSLQAVILVADVLSGARLQLASAFGYSPIVGARFYGIGNEAVALLLGAILIGLAAALPLDGRQGGRALVWALLAFVFAMVVVGHPRLGANTGGVLAAVAAFAAWRLALAGGRGRAEARRAWFLAVTVAVLLIAALAAFVWVDSQRPSDAQTHMGRAAQTIIQGGLPALQRVVLRKLTANMRLAMWTPWAFPGLAIMLVTIISAFRSNRLVERAYAAAPSLRPAAVGIAVSAIVGFLCNDSGLPMAGIFLSFVICTVCFVTMRTLAEGRRPSGNE